MKNFVNGSVCAVLCMLVMQGAQGARREPGPMEGAGATIGGAVGTVVGGGAGAWIGRSAGSWGSRTGDVVGAGVGGVAGASAGGRAGRALDEGTAHGSGKTFGERAGAGLRDWDNLRK